MPVLLPITPSVPDQQFTTTLAGVVYQIRAKWNTRDESWYMDLRTPSGDPIRLGLRLVLGAKIGRQCADPRMPAGTFVLIDTSKEDREATLDDMGTRVVLQFTSHAEVAAMDASLDAADALS